MVPEDLVVLSKDSGSEVNQPDSVGTGISVNFLKFALGRVDSGPHIDRNGFQYALKGGVLLFYLESKGQWTS